jgi:uncharacterized membrane protein (DUF2068 family)
MSAPSSRVAPWEDFVLRVIAIWKLGHAVFFTAVGFELLKLRHHNVDDFLNNWIDFLNSLHIFHINPESHFVDWLLDHAHRLAPWMSFAGYAAFVYAALFATEGIGLYLRKRWAEWLVVAATGSFLPFELWALFKHFMWWKILLLLGNLSIVAYLTHRILLDSRMKARESKPPEDKRGPEAADGFSAKAAASRGGIRSTGVTR